MVVIHLLIITWISLVSQTSGITDSLEYQLSLLENEKRIAVLVDLAEIYILKDQPKSRIYLQEALGLAQVHKDLRTRANILKKFGLSFYYEGNYTEATVYLNQALEVCQEQSDSIQMANVLYNLSLIDRELRNWEKALERALFVLELDIKNGDSSGLGYSYHQLALIYQNLNDFKNSAEFNYKAIKIRKKIRHKELPHTYLNLGNVKIKIEQPDSAFLYFQQAALAFEERKDWYHHAKAIYSLGNSCWIREQYQEAQKYYLQAYQERKAVAAGPVDMAESTISLGVVAQHELKYKEADSLYRQAQVLAEEKEDIRLLRDIYLKRSRNAILRQNWEEAFGYQERYYQYNQQMIDLEELRKFKNLEITHTLERKEIELAKLKEENFLEQENNKLSSKVNAILILGLLITIIFIYWVLQIKENHLKLLNGKNRELEKLNQSLDQFTYIVSHDLKAPLASSKGLIRLMEQEKPNPTIAHYLRLQRQNLNKQEVFIKDLLDFSRSSRKEIVPIKLDFKSLMQEVIEQLQFEPDATPVKIDYHIDLSSEFYSDELRLKMILSNLISNSVRFRNPYQENPFVKVNFKMIGNFLELEVSDNGIGIHPDNLDRIFAMFFKAGNHPESTGLGLYIVKEALDKLKGTVQVESPPGCGTTFRLRIPNRPTVHASG